MASEGLDQSKALARLYDGMAASYDDVARSAGYSVPAWIQKKSRPLFGRSLAVLDLACANGLIGRSLADAGLRASKLVGLDLSPEMVRACRDSGLYDEVIVHDLACGLPAGFEGTFDLALACGVIEFIENPRTFLRDLAGALRRGGDALLSFERSSDGDFASYVAQTPSGPVWRRAYSQTAAEELLRDAGMTVVSIESAFAYVSPVTGAHVDYWLCHARSAG